MTLELEALARRLVACPRWRWMPGMLWSIGPQPGWVRASTGRVLSALEDGGPVRAPRSCLPDLTDPATLGCLASLVREAWSGLVVISLGAGWWSVQTNFKDWDQDNTKSFVDALVAALEAAP